MPMSACLLQGIPVDVAEHARELARRQRCSINDALLAMLAHAVSCSSTPAARAGDADATCHAVPTDTARDLPGATTGPEPAPSTEQVACMDVAVDVAAPSPPASTPAHASEGAAHDALTALAAARSTGDDALSTAVATNRVATAADDAAAAGWAIPDDSSLEAAEALALREALMAARMVPCG